MECKSPLLLSIPDGKCTKYALHDLFESIPFLELTGNMAYEKFRYFQPVYKNSDGSLFRIFPFSSRILSCCLAETEGKKKLGSLFTVSCNYFEFF